MHTYIYFLFHVLFHYDLSQDIGYSSLCYTVGPYYLSVFCILICLEKQRCIWLLLSNLGLKMITGSSSSALPLPHWPQMEKWMESVEMLSLRKNNTVSSALQLVDDSNTTRKVMHYALKPGEILCVCLRCCLWTIEWTKIFDTFRISWFRKRKHLSSSLLHDVPSNLTFLPP